MPAFMPCRIVPPPVHVAQLVSHKNKLWRQPTLTVRFDDAPGYNTSGLSFTELCTFVKNTVNTGLAPHVPGIEFLFLEPGTRHPADIRITFDSADGAWSYIGTDAQIIADTAPTMNLGYVDHPLEPRETGDYGQVILHEFGHALGFGHEHQSPLSTIEWNIPMIRSVMMAEPFCWTDADIAFNITDRYTSPYVTGGDVYDPLSIMHYWFPDSFIVNGNKWLVENTTLSYHDMVNLEKCYPKDPTVVTEDSDDEVDSTILVGILISVIICVIIYLIIQSQLRRALPPVSVSPSQRGD